MSLEMEVKVNITNNKLPGFPKFVKRFWKEVGWEGEVAMVERAAYDTGRLKSSIEVNWRTGSISIHPQVQYAGYANLRAIRKGANIKGWKHKPTTRAIVHDHGPKFDERTAKHLEKSIPKIFDLLYKKMMGAPT